MQSRAAERQHHTTRRINRFSHVAVGRNSPTRCLVSRGPSPSAPPIRYRLLCLYTEPTPTSCPLHKNLGGRFGGGDSSLQPVRGRPRGEWSTSQFFFPQHSAKKSASVQCVRAGRPEGTSHAIDQVFKQGVSSALRAKSWRAKGMYSARPGKILGRYVQCPQVILVIIPLMADS
jgi:hypothetical protein